MRLRARAAALLLTLLGLGPAATAAGGGTAPPDQGDEGTLRAGQDMALSHTLNGRTLDGALRQKLGHCTGQTPPSARCLDAIRACTRAATWATCSMTPPSRCDRTWAMA